MPKDTLHQLPTPQTVYMHSAGLAACIWGVSKLHSMV